MSKRELELTSLSYSNKRTASSTCSSCNSSSSSTPEPATFVYIVKQQFESSTHSSIIGIYSRLEDANNKAYCMRLDLETCHPCFFYYGEDISGGCLSWDVPGDGEDEVGVKVFVEREEVVGIEVGEKRNWRSALEPFTTLNEPHWGPFKHR